MKKIWKQSRTYFNKTCLMALNLTRPLNIVVGHLRLSEIETYCIAKKKKLNVNSTWELDKRSEYCLIEFKFQFHIMCCVHIFADHILCKYFNSNMYVCSYSNEMQALLRNFWSAIRRLLFDMLAKKNERELISNICHLAHSYTRNAFHKSRMEKEF